MRPTHCVQMVVVRLGIADPCRLSLLVLSVSDPQLQRH